MFKNNIWDYGEFQIQWSPGNSNVLNVKCSSGIVNVIVGLFSWPSDLRCALEYLHELLEAAGAFDIPLFQQKALRQCKSPTLFQETIRERRVGQTLDLSWDP